MNRLLLDSPCVFCGYCAASYYQSKTHAEDCPWLHVGGLKEREDALRAVIKQLIAERTLAESAAQRMQRLAERLWEKVNNRRCDLIKWSVSKEASERDLAELAELQALADEYIHIMAPLPIEKLEAYRAAIGEGNDEVREGGDDAVTINRRSEKYYTAERARNNSILLHIPAAAYYLTWAEATQLCHSLIEALGISAQLNGRIESERSE